MRAIATIAAAFAAACLCSSAFAETLDERKACIGDAFSVCWSAIPDRHEVYLCLQKHKSRLSGDCRMVMNRHPLPQTAKR